MASARRPSRATASEADGSGKGNLVSEIVTANRLADGVVVFQDSEGGWPEDFARAAVHDDPAAAKAALAKAGEAVAQCLIVDPYLIVVELRNGHCVPKA